MKSQNKQKEETDFVEMLEYSLLLLCVQKESGKIIISSIHINKIIEESKLLPLMKKYFDKTEESKLKFFYFSSKFTKSGDKAANHFIEETKLIKKSFTHKEEEYTLTKFNDLDLESVKLAIGNQFSFF